MKCRENPSKHRAGDILSLTIESAAAGGDGVGRIGELVCFVPYTAPGDRVQVRIVQSSRRFLKGELYELEEAGPHRSTPECPVFGVCGGCDWMHIAPSEQLRAKGRILARALGLHPVEITPSPSLFGYRSRARLHFQKIEDTLQLGFNAARTQEIVDIRNCPVLAEPLNRCIAPLREALGNTQPIEGEVILAAGRNGVAAHVAFQNDTVQSSLYAALSSLDQSMFCSVSLCADGIETQLSGASVVEIEGTDGRPFYYPASSFGQANPGVNRAIADFLRSAVAEKHFQKGIELFAGAGNHSITVAPSADSYIASELDARAVREAAANFAARGLDHARAIAGEAAGIYETMGQDADLVVLNPPRTGHPELAAAAATRKPSDVLYVSCNPATLARDIAHLTAVGYRIRDVRGFDMFPHTSHMEAAVLLTC